MNIASRVRRFVFSGARRGNSARRSPLGIVHYLHIAILAGKRSAAALVASTNSPLLIFMRQKTKGGLVYMFKREGLIMRRPIIVEHKAEPRELEPDELEILEYWNSKGIVKHKPTLKRLDVALRNALSNYDKTEIMAAIDNYSEVLQSNYSLRYVWNLPTFLMKSNAMPDYLPDGAKWQNYLRWKETQKPTDKPKPEPIAEPVFSLDIDIYGQALNWLKTIPYSEYLQTDHWQHFRKQALKWSHNTCQLCGATNIKLDVHHRTYANRGRETFLDVIVLCQECHAMYHQHKCSESCARCAGESMEHEATM
jgi:hypothetical protein